MRRYLVPSAWGLAFAAFVLALLGLADFRIELIENGVGFRFGPPASPPAAQRGTGAGAGAGADSLTMHPGLVSMLGSLSGSSTEPGPYVTREEFQQYAMRTAHVLSEMARTFEADQTDARDVAGFMQAMYRSLNDQQREQYYDLRGHIEAVKVGLSEVRTSTNDRLEGLFENNPGEPLVPQYPVPSPFGSQKGFEDDQ